MGEVFLASTTGIEGAERPVVVKIIRREHAKAVRTHRFESTSTTTTVTV